MYIALSVAYHFKRKGTIHYAVLCEVKDGLEHQKIIDYLKTYAMNRKIMYEDVQKDITRAITIHVDFGGGEYYNEMFTMKVNT